MRLPRTFDSIAVRAPINFVIFFSKTDCEPFDLVKHKANLVTDAILRRQRNIAQRFDRGRQFADIIFQAIQA